MILVGLNDSQMRRYARHVLLPDVGGTGQARLLRSAARVADEAAILYLAAAGVGTLIVGERAPVAAAGLLFEAADVGRPWLDAVRDRVGALNPDVQVMADGAGIEVQAVVSADDPAARLEAGARAARLAIAELLRT